MTDRVFQDDYSFEVSDCYGDIDFHCSDDGDVYVTVTQGHNDRASFNIERDEVKMMMEFFKAKGF
jgi:hypothetical protein